jgi:hypothetical protein
MHAFSAALTGHMVGKARARFSFSGLTARLQFSRLAAKDQETEDAGFNLVQG